jgi:hypothetical protein
MTTTAADRRARDRSAPSAGFAVASSEGGSACLRWKCEDAATLLARLEAKLENVEGRGIQETLPGGGAE